MQLFPLIHAPANAPMPDCLRASSLWLSDTLTRVSRTVDDDDVQFCRTSHRGHSAPRTISMQRSRHGGLGEGVGSLVRIAFVFHAETPRFSWRLKIFRSSLFDLSHAPDFNFEFPLSRFPLSAFPLFAPNPVGLADSSRRSHRGATSGRAVKSPRTPHRGARYSRYSYASGAPGVALPLRSEIQRTVGGFPLAGDCPNYYQVLPTGIQFGSVPPHSGHTTL